MSKITGVSNFRSGVYELVKQYGDSVLDTLEKVMVETAEQGAQDMKTSGDFGGTGKYKRAWTSSVFNRRTGTEAVIHNKTQYQLTHLLEFGHAKQNGGRTRAFVHIAPINDKVQEEFIRKFEEGVRNL